MVAAPILVANAVPAVDANGSNTVQENSVKKSIKDIKAKQTGLESGYYIGNTKQLHTTMIQYLFG